MDTYTPNIKEKIRLDIAKMLLIHEFKKLFRCTEVKLPRSFEEISIDIDQMVKKVQDGDEVGIRDFWNLVDSIMMGYKLKDIVKKITSACIDWRLEPSISIQNLRFTSNITDIPVPDIKGKSASEVYQELKSKPKLLNMIKNKIIESYPENDTRHKDPILVTGEGKGQFVLDGNGRLLRAIVYDIETLPTYIGIRNSMTKSNHWVATSYLQRLKDGSETEKSVKQLIEDIRESSQNAQYELKGRVTE